MTQIAQAEPILTIDIVSDVVCPWCFIGKRKLEAALQLPQAANLPPVHIRWHPFQLNPDRPAESAVESPTGSQVFPDPPHPFRNS